MLEMWYMISTQPNSFLRVPEHPRPQRVDALYQALLCALRLFPTLFRRHIH